MRKFEVGKYRSKFEMRSFPKQLSHQVSIFPNLGLLFFAGPVRLADLTGTSESARTTFTVCGSLG